MARKTNLSMKKVPLLGVVALGSLLMISPGVSAHEGDHSKVVTVPEVQTTNSGKFVSAADRHAGQPAQLARNMEDDGNMAILPGSEKSGARKKQQKVAPEERENTAIIPGSPYPEANPKQPPEEDPEVAVQPPQSKVYPSQGQPSAFLERPKDLASQPYNSGRYRVYHYMPETGRYMGTEALMSELSREVAGKVFYKLKDDGEKNHTARVAIVGAVPLSDLKRETEFGRMIAEYLLTDLSDRGIKVTELRLGKEINILAQTGEFILSRNISELANNNQELDYVVVTTFSNTRKTLVLNGRLVSLKNGIIKSSWRYTLPLNRELLGLFHTVNQPYTIAVKGMAN